MEKRNHGGPVAHVGNPRAFLFNRVLDGFRQQARICPGDHLCSAGGEGGLNSLGTPSRVNQHFLTLKARSGFASKLTCEV